MASLWDRIQALEGRTLPTVNGRETFDVAEAEVDEHRIRVVPRSTGKPGRPIPRWQFERVEALALATVDLRPSHLEQANVDDFNWSYIAAIVRAAIGQRPPT
jgi:hypothetical protein